MVKDIIIKILYKIYNNNLSSFSNNKFIALNKNILNKEKVKKNKLLGEEKRNNKISKIFPKNKRKNIYIKNIFNNLIFILLFIFIPLSLTKKNNRYLISLFQITITINGAGDQQIINETFNYIPSSVYVNGYLSNIENRKIKNLTETNNIVTMYFNNIITDGSYMFYNLTNITSIDLSQFDSSKIVNMSFMFSYCKNLEYLNFNNFNTSSVKDMSYMFYYCSNLKSLDLSNFCTYNVINMKSMFQNCFKLESINIESFRTTSLKNISSMFASCQSLTNLDLHLFNTSFITDMDYLFYQCYKLKNLDITSFNTSIVTNIRFLFSDCQSLTSLNLSNFNTTSIIYMDYLFSNCYNLTYLDLSNFITSSIKSMAFLFGNCFYLTSLDLSNFNTSSSINMEGFFYNCINLTFIDISSFNTSHVVDMSYFFYNCSSLSSLNLLNFNTSSVNNMKSLFHLCKKLKSLDLSNFNTSNVACMWDMFNGCSSLQFLDISSFNTSKVTDMDSMFEDCSSLVSLDLSHFNTTLVYYMNNMFCNCSNLEYVDLRNINSNSLGTMYQMFLGCSKLKYINLYSLNKSSQDINEMFYETSVNFKYCIKNEDKITNIYKLIKDLYYPIRDCSSDCYPEPRKLIVETNKCEYYNCSENETHKFDYNHFCYINCPKRTYIKLINNNICENLNCSNYYNFNQTECIDIIPDGYFLNDSIQKTIDECHPDCKTCEQKPSINSTNCKSCKSDKFIHLGNCLSSCHNGFYYDELNNSTKTCNCEEIKCLNCSIESLTYNLCISCNKDYFPIYNDSSNIYPYINCYKNPDGYYLDKNDNYYKLCYTTCKKCNGFGNEKNNNCLECKDNYLFKEDFPNDKNCYPQCINYYYFDHENKYFCTEDEKCPKEYYKLIEEKRRCIDECSKDNIYKYEFKNKCYKECPLKTKNNNFYCNIECPLDFPYEIKETQECVKNCTKNDLEIKRCILNNENILLMEKEDEFVGNVQDNMENGKYNLTNIDEGKDIVYEKDGTSITVTTTDNQKKNENKNVTTIDLGECEDKLRDEYNIQKNKSLYILMIKVNETGMKIPKVEYEVYYPFNGINLEKLDLKVCKDIKIDISIPVNINENDLDRHNSSSSYYNDLCYTYTSEKGTDITLNDRKKEFVENNYTLCEEDCDLSGYESKTKKALCSCQVKIKLPLISEINIDKNRLFDSFSKVKNFGNMKIMKCYRVLFTKNGITNNIGCYILFPIILFHFISIIIFYLKDYKIIKNIIKSIYEALKNKKDICIEKDIKIVNKRKRKKSKTQNNNKKHIKKKKIFEKKTEIKNENIIKNENNLNSLNRNDEIKKKDIPKEFEETIKININNETKKNNIPKILEPIFIKFLRRKTIIERKMKKDLDFKDDTKNKDTNFPPLKKIKNKRNNYSINTLKTNDNKKLEMSNHPLNSMYKSMNLDNKMNFYKKIMQYNDYELNTLQYDEALKLDKRNYIQYYFSLLKIKDLLIYSFYPSNDYNSRIIKIYLFFFSFTIYYTVNCLFFNEATMHQIYADDGSFNFIYQIPQIIYSSLISSILNIILKTLSLTEKNILEIKHIKQIENLDNKVKGVSKSLHYKFILFFIISFIFLLFFWYYLACFCAVYKNTQLHLIKDSLISFSLSLLYPVGLCLIPGFFRIPSLRAEKKNKETMYKFSKLIQFI